MKIDFDKIIYETKAKATSLLNDNDGLKELLNKAKKMLEGNKELKSIVADVKMLVQLVKDHINGEYKELSNNTIILVLISLIYLVNPIDLIPDFMIGGFLDDAAVLTFVLKKIQTELQNYKDWQSRDEEGIDYIEITIDQTDYGEE